MESQDALDQATTIARDAHAKARAADLETNVQAFERSDHRTLKSLARVYRMLQRPQF
jgi:hypothetical protein